MAARGLKIAALGALLLVGSCASPQKTPVAPPPAPPKPAPLSVAPAPLAIAPPPKDACGAGALQYLVGRSRTDIPVPVDPSRRRVACTTCPITQDFVTWRQTILYDAHTGLVTSVRCG
jgi:hypothetical protein